MDATAHIIAGYRNYAQFSGRSTRSEYWVFAAFLFVAQILSFLVAPVAALLFLVGSALPGLSASARRLHDVGRSGWWLVLPVLVVPGWLLVWIASAAAAMAVRQDALDNDIYFLSASAVMLVVVGVFVAWLAMPSQPGANPYGPNPIEEAA
jgi:uncharacterized membrane protein YhaH (DUF805 family)